jgi:hypothetical protein
MTFPNGDGRQDVQKPVENVQGRLGQAIGNTLAVSIS